MSGGAFDYAQYRIADIYTEIEDEIYGHSLDIALLGVVQLSVKMEKM